MPLRSSQHNSISESIKLQEPAPTLTGQEELFYHRKKNKVLFVRHSKNLSKNSGSKRQEPRSNSNNNKDSHNHFKSSSNIEFEIQMSFL